MEFGPAAMANRPIAPHNSSTPSAVAIAGRLLDGAFFCRLATDTGVEQSVPSHDGRRLLLASSLGENLTSSPIEHHPALTALAAGATTLIVNDRRYAARFLAPERDASTLYIEAALLVDDLIATRTALSPS